MDYLCFENIDSTNTYLLENYQQYPNFFIVEALSQNKGRGRSGRVWNSSKAKNLTFSLLIKEKKLLQQFSSLSIIAAYSVIQTLEQFGITDLSIKWPNDVYYKNDKIAGILLEAISKNEMECLVVGIGLNVNQMDFPDDLKQKATSCRAILGKKLEIEDLRRRLFPLIKENFSACENHKDFYQEIINYDYLKGKKVFASVHNVLKEVDVLGINEDYSLKIKSDNQILDMISGEISFHK